MGWGEGHERAYDRFCVEVGREKTAGQHVVHARMLGNGGILTCVLKVSATEREKPSRYIRLMMTSPFWLMKSSAAIIVAPTVCS